MVVGAVAEADDKTGAVNDETIVVTDAETDVDEAVELTLTVCVVDPGKALLPVPLAVLSSMLVVLLAKLPANPATVNGSSKVPS